MDDTTRALIEKITIRYPEPRPILGGHTSNIFFDCNKLSPNDLARLAAEATGHLDHDAFDIAVGLAYNGIFFAAAVAGGRGIAILQTDGKVFGPDLKAKRIVIASDVVMDGKQIEQAAQLLAKLGAKVVGFACIVDRSGGRVGAPSTPLWSAVQAPLAA
ncbi:MAG: hypothetical protein K1X83_10375 [Oligoflexia bacterium]|nr:hypothetical protein [Oligoflexia bacterium]